MTRPSLISVSFWSHVGGAGRDSRGRKGVKIPKETMVISICPFPDSFRGCMEAHDKSQSQEDFAVKEGTESLRQSHLVPQTTALEDLRKIITRRPEVSVHTLS